MSDELVLITAATFRTMARKGATAADLAGHGVLKFGGITADVATPPHTIAFVLSDPSVDREGDTIDANGWDLTDYQKNPVVLWAHDHSQLPVGKALSTYVDGGQLKAIDQFADASLHPFADTVYRMLQQGYLNACSVGFQPSVWDMTDTGVAFAKQALLEHSVCPVPAHPQALVIARSKGINVAPLKAWAEKTLDLLARAKGDGSGVLRRQAETLRAQADERTFMSLAGSDDTIVPIKRPAPRAKAAPRTSSADQLMQRVSKALGAIQTKEGRVLSQANENSLRQAAQLIEGVLAQLDGKRLTVDGVELPDLDDIDKLLSEISPAEMRRIIERAVAGSVNDLMMQVTGRVD